MSRSYQIFMKQKIEEKCLEDLVSKLNGYKNDIGDFTIQKQDSCIWINYTGAKIDEEYYAEEIEEVLTAYNFNIMYVINIELSSGDYSDEVAVNFYKELKKINRDSILMNQDGEYFNYD